MKIRPIRFAILIACVTRFSFAAVDLAEKYPATLDYDSSAPALDWTCEASDVFRLAAFKYALGDQFRIKLGPSWVAFGKNGTNVLWAAVYPLEIGTIETASHGSGEHITSIWLRFNPALVGELFPAESVIGPGEAGYALLGKRLYHHKIRASWQAGDKPVIPWKHSIVIDMETAEGTRRFFMMDTQKKEAKYEPHFEKQTLPELVRIPPDAALAAFDSVWESFDREYAMFTIKPQVDWNALRNQYRPRLAEAHTNYEAAAVISEMLAHLEDLHVWVKAGNEFVPGYTRERPFNMNTGAVRPNFPDIADTRQGLGHGKSTDGIGYINVYQLGNQQLPNLFDEALEKFSDTWGLVIDLRMNGGGDELLARAMAGRFLSEPRVYSLNQYRSGPNHGDLGPKLERKCEPRGPWRYESPIVVLIGQRVMSSAESFALMLAQAPNATLIGDRTAGSSANPRLVNAGATIHVNLPRWLDLLPDGTPLDPAGVPPDIRVEASPEDFRAQDDPVLAKALDHLRAIPTENRLPGRRAQ